MTATATRPKLANPDIAASELVSRAYDEAERCEFLVATIPSRSDPARRHTVRGHSHGRDAVCSCWGFTRHKHCVHASAFVLIIEELERQHYSDPKYTTEGLLRYLDYFARIPDILSPDQRLRRNGIHAALASRGVSYRATRTLAEQRAVAERAAGARAILFGE